MTFGWVLNYSLKLIFHHNFHCCYWQVLSLFQYFLLRIFSDLLFKSSVLKSHADLCGNLFFRLSEECSCTISLYYSLMFSSSIFWQKILNLQYQFPNFLLCILLIFLESRRGVWRRKRKRRGEKEREKEALMWDRIINQVPPTCAPNGDQTCHLGMFLTRNQTLHLLMYRTTLQPTEPHQPGLTSLIFLISFFPCPSFQVCMLFLIFTPFACNS